MSIIAAMWNDGDQITIKGASAPKSSYGPALAVGPNTFYIAYLGEGGKNLYMCYRDVDVQDPASWATSPWQGNKQIKLPNGTEPTANDRPAIAVFPSDLLLVYTDHNSGHLKYLTYSLAQGWRASNPPIDVFPAGKRFRQPLMTTSSFNAVAQLPDFGAITEYNKIVHLVAMDETGDLWYSSSSFDLDLWGGDEESDIFQTPWQQAQKLDMPAGVQGVVNWSLTSVADTAYLFGFTNNLICVFRSQAPADQFEYSQWEYFITQYPPEEINPWAAVASFETSMRLIFTPKGGEGLYTALPAGDDTTPDLTGTASVDPGGVQAATDKAPAATAFPLGVLGPAQTMLVAYKADSSDKLYFSYLT